MIGRWRSHAHLTVLARVEQGQSDALFDAIADAALDRDEGVECGGSLTDWDRSDPIATFEVTGYRMRRRAAEAMRSRVLDALDGVRRDFRPPPAEIRTVLTARCRCNQPGAS